MRQASLKSIQLAICQIVGSHGLANLGTDLDDVKSEIDNSTITINDGDIEYEFQSEVNSVDIIIHINIQPKKQICVDSYVCLEASNETLMSPKEAKEVQAELGRYISLAEIIDGTFKDVKII